MTKDILYPEDVKNNHNEKLYKKYIKELYTEVNKENKNGGKKNGK